MVSQKRRSKEGIFLIRKTVKEGNETRHMIAVGAGTQLIKSPKPDDLTPDVESEQPESDTVQLGASIIAAKKHIQKVTSSNGKITQSVSDKLNRRLSHCFLPPSKVEAPPNIPIEEFLAGTPIFYKAVLALQSRYGGYLTFNDLNIDATSRMVLQPTQFVIMNADNLGDDGNMKYGQAVWLVVDNRRVLGSQYEGIGDLRKLRPALIKCSKAHLFKAHHIGRWILMNRDDPIGKMGKNCLHGDRIMLEQEWLFLSSSPQCDVTLYKTKSTIANATLKPSYNVDYFEPIEDCTWRVRLVAQKDMGTTDGRKRTQLITRANTQLVTSLRGRWKLKDDLFGQLSEKMDKKLETEKVKNSLKHKSSNKLEQDHLIKLYHEMSSNNFLSPQMHHSQFRKDSDSENEGNMSPASKTGPKPLVKQNSDNSRDFVEFKGSPASTVRARMRRKSAQYSNNLNYNRLTSTLNLERMENSYWRIAQKLLVKTDAWSVLDSAMVKYYNGPHKQLKIKAAIVIQRFIRENCQFLGMLERRMGIVDNTTTTRLSMKNEWKNDFEKVLQVRKEIEINEKDEKNEKDVLDTPYKEETTESRKLTSPFSFRLLANTMSHDIVITDNSIDIDDDSVAGKNRGYNNNLPKMPSALSDFMAKNFPSSLMLPQKPGENTGKPFNDIMRPLPEFLNSIIVTEKDIELKSISRPPLRKSLSYNPPSARHANFEVIRSKVAVRAKDSNLIPERTFLASNFVAAPWPSISATSTRPTVSSTSPRPSPSHTSSPRPIVSSISPRPSTSSTPRRTLSPRPALSSPPSRPMSSSSSPTPGAAGAASVRKIEKSCGEQIGKGEDNFLSNMTALKLPQTHVRPQTAQPRLQQPRDTYNNYSFEKQIESNSNSEIQEMKIKSNDTSIDASKISIEKQQRRQLRRDAREQRQREKKIEENKLIARLGASSDNPCGLPGDVFENMHGKVSAKTGFNFLKSASLNPNVYNVKNPSKVFY